MPCARVVGTSDQTLGTEEYPTKEKEHHLEGL